MSQRTIGSPSRCITVSGATMQYGVGSVAMTLNSTALNCQGKLNYIKLLMRHSLNNCCKTVQENGVVYHVKLHHKKTRVHIDPSKNSPCTIEGLAFFPAIH